MSEYAGQSHTVKKSRKDYLCQWCGQQIEIGQSYVHWLWFCDGKRSTVKAHPECFDYANATRETGDWAWFNGDRHRPETNYHDRKE